MTKPKPLPFLSAKQTPLKAVNSGPQPIATLPLFGFVRKPVRRPTKVGRSVTAAAK